MNIHPAVLITCFLVLVSALAFSTPSTLLLSTLLMIFLYSRDGGAYFHSALVMLRRMRWFLFSILIVYCWFTPGEPLLQWAVLEAWLPTYEGFLSGMQRVIALAIVIASVNLLLCTLSREQLLSAILFLVRPLWIIGVKPEMVALRMVLVFDAMAEAQLIISQHIPEKGKIPRQLDEIGKLSATVFSAVVERAKNTPPHEVALSMMATPPVFQWIYPLMLWGVLSFTGMLWVQ